MIDEVDANSAYKLRQFKDQSTVCLLRFFMNNISKCCLGDSVSSTVYKCENVQCQ